MEKVDIKSREDLHLLVYTFYEKIKIESTLGPIFIRAIKDWPTHIDHITDFGNHNYCLPNDIEVTLQKFMLE